MARPRPRPRSQIRATGEGAGVICLPAALASPVEDDDLRGRFSSVSRRSPPRYSGPPPSASGGSASPPTPSSSAAFAPTTASSAPSCAATTRSSSPPNNLDPPGRTRTECFCLGRYGLGDRRYDIYFLGYRHGRALLKDMLQEEFVVCDLVTGERRCVALPPNLSLNRGCINGAVLCAAARTLEPGTPSIPPSASSCSFSALESVPLGNLAKVASDSAIIFRGEVGPPLAQIAAIRAREVLDGKLAEARAALLVPPAASTSGGSSSPPRPQPTAPPPSVAVPEIRGRTHSCTAALRALRASCVLGSSSPPMAP